MVCLTNDNKRLAFAKSDVAAFFVVTEPLLVNIQAPEYAFFTRIHGQPARVLPFRSSLQRAGGLGGADGFGGTSRPSTGGAEVRQQGHLQQLRRV